ncbi:MAG TPA: pentapeptide repeat-containing protein [Steroidobacteraceae bacterium]|nr:pentapeptide repeat-containing protein [Steroidobacteraceae bacterium]
MNYQIKHRFTDAVLFDCELPEEIAAQPIGAHLRYAILQAVKAGAYLAGAYLARAYLAGADLAGAYLAGAYLAGADLADARNVPAGVSTDQPESGEQKLSRQDRYARRAARFRERNPDVPVIADIDERILGIVERGEGKLKMDAWHTCATTHCMAGWAVTLAGDAGKKLEEQHGPQRAGRMIYTASIGRTPHFFATNERAIEAMRERIAEKSASPE